MTPTESGNTAPASLSRDAITRILALAEKAAPGPYHVHDDNEGEQHSFWTVVNDDFDKEDTLEYSPVPLQAALHYGAKDDAEYFAALDPATVIALCDLAEKAI